VPIDIETRLQDAVQQFWLSRERQQQKQVEAGKIDAGTRGAVTGGSQMGALEVLIRDVLMEAGLKDLDIKTRTALELPGYYRPEKKWDLIVIAEGKLVLAMEFKSQVGPSFGNNFNNRSEEAIGSASDVWVAYREGRFGKGPAPFLGYLFLLEDCAAVHKPVSNSEPYFKVEPIFVSTSYSKRYEILAQRLMLERLYTSACLLLSTNENPTKISEPVEDLSFKKFVAALRGHAITFLNSQNS
jgi:hypothetical protein